MTRISADYIFENDEAKILSISKGEQIKLQGIGSGTYKLKGRLSTDCAFDEICVVKATTLATTREVSDTSVYIADISGYAQITVEALGFDKIFATVVG